MIVAIDGPAGSGKSTAARNLARRLGLVYINTGAMYRAVALVALETRTDLRDEEKLAAIARSIDIRFEHQGDETRYVVNGRDRTADLFSAALTEKLAPIVNSPRVRSVLVERMREMARGKDVVMEGRDIGTVVFPDADHKFYLKADIAERARRRAAELLARGENVDIEAIRERIAARDEIDRSRTTGPLARADDAIEVDTSRLTAKQTLECLLEHIKTGRKGGTADRQGDSPCGCRRK